MSLIPGASASEIYHLHDKWYISLISHLKNGLHFFEIRRLKWNKNGTVSVKQLD